MMQIDTSTNHNNNNTQQHINSDAEKLYLQELVQEYLNQEEIIKRIKSLMGRGGSRQNINMDELR